VATQPAIAEAQATTTTSDANRFHVRHEEYNGQKRERSADHAAAES
jgi:hypothetical protein